ncbi:pseudouridine synthase [Methyloversatilis thermotolerans]|uniref:pseudouridine synthase n=1 Tax=Methyloversatilis thermotolerans TaxID=1346290 RepID=UPI0003643471|nr:pseudouridine synthase [Methyloversatilis thermotolerans]
MSAPPLDILYRDDVMVAIDKPSGLLVHRSALDRHETEFALQRLRDQIGQHVWPVHRLDRGTSGVLVFALDATAAHALADQFARHAPLKRYVAVVRGHPPPEGVIDHPLRRLDDAMDPRAPREGVVPPAAQPAVTRYRTLATAVEAVAVDRYPTSRYALVEAEPLTGRMHQIRRHLKHIAHPVIGDATYGKGAHNRLIAGLCGESRLLLACIHMQLAHPATGQPVDLRCPPGSAFERLAVRWGWASFG